MISEYRLEKSWLLWKHVFSLDPSHVDLYCHLTLYWVGPLACPYWTPLDEVLPLLLGSDAQWPPQRGQALSLAFYASSAPRPM